MELRFGVVLGCWVIAFARVVAGVLGFESR